MKSALAEMLILSSLVWGQTVSTSAATATTMTFKLLKCSDEIGIGGHIYSGREWAKLYGGICVEPAPERKAAKPQATTGLGSNASGPYPPKDEAPKPNILDLNLGEWIEKHCRIEEQHSYTACVQGKCNDNKGLQIRCDQ